MGQNGRSALKNFMLAAAAVALLWVAMDWLALSSSAGCSAAGDRALRAAGRPTSWRSRLTPPMGRT
ncbi:hypothetical protein ACFQZC_01215 [Streptacidiphilus monticola]